MLFANDCFWQDLQESSELKKRSALIKDSIACFFFFFLKKLAHFAHRHAKKKKKVELKDIKDWKKIQS